PPHLQPPPLPHRTRRPTSDQPRQQRSGSIHLGQGDFLRSCDYDSLLGSSGGEPFTLHLYKGKYEVTVYEARSGKPLGSTEIQGDAIFGTDDRPCPGTAVKPDNPRDNAKEGLPRPAQLREVLAPYVNGG
ncbi:hypothetical protein ACWHAQ_30890, partial [Streptomyces koyangensis]